MLTIVICDDDIRFAEQFQSSVRNAFLQKGIPCKIDIFDNAPGLLTALSHQHYDIICLDIEIGRISGIDIGNQIRDTFNNLKSQIVFISSYSSYHQAGELYDCSPMAFIHKPYTAEDVNKIVRKAISRILPPAHDDTCFVFEHDRKKYNIRKADIVYTESQKRKKIIHTIDGKSYAMNSNMKNIVKTLDDPGFVLIHCSYYVNMRYIEYFGPSKVTLKTGMVLDVSSQNYTAARRAFSEFLEQQDREIQYV